MGNGRGLGPGRQPCRKLKGSDQAGGIGAASAGDVEGRPVVGGGAHERQAQSDVDRVIESQRLDRNQRLVVVHRKRRVIARARRPMEQRIGGQRTAGLQVWDRSDKPLSELIEQLNAANRIADATEREAAVRRIREGAPAGPRRVFVGKTADRSASVSLADAAGKPRLTLTVDAAGNPRIEFLDENGKIVERIPQGSK